jgi:hypothetical protein
MTHLNLPKINLRPNQDYESNPVCVDYINNPRGLLSQGRESINSRPAGGLDQPKQFPGNRLAAHAKSDIGKGELTCEQ